MSAKLAARLKVGRAILPTVVVMACFSGTASFAIAAPTEGDSKSDCDLPSGVLSTEELPAGSSVIECDAIGRKVVDGGAGVTVPPPGLAVSIEALQDDGTTDGFVLAVSEAGVVSYPAQSGSMEASEGPGGYDHLDSAGGVPEASAEGEEPAPDYVPDPAEDPDAPEVPITEDEAATTGTESACADGAYNVNDQKEYGTYNWFIGDGGMPGALSRANAQQAFAAAISNITGQQTNCGAYDSDQVSASADYQGTTTYEADISSSLNCTDRDEKSTWDAGDLPSGTVAATCSWTVPTPGVKNDLVEADVRYNTADKDFTNKITNSCNNRYYDIRSVGTHEAGHVFGMGHVSSGHENLTMYTSSFLCKAKARTLGKGDVLGLRSIY